jgi:hypothetical protein
MVFLSIPSALCYLTNRQRTDSCGASVTDCGDATGFPVQASVARVPEGVSGHASVAGSSFQLKMANSLSLGPSATQNAGGWSTRPR